MFLWLNNTKNLICDQSHQNENENENLCFLQASGIIFPFRRAYLLFQIWISKHNTGPGSIILGLHDNPLLTPFFDDPELQPTFSNFSKFKKSIQTVQHDGYIKMCLQIKFYMFLNFFYYILRWIQKFNALKIMIL